MNKFILLGILLFLANSIKAQETAISDTITILDFYSHRDNLTSNIHRKSYVYTPLDDECNQNFQKLRMEKVSINNQTLYVLVYDKILVRTYDLHGYVTLAVDFGRKSPSMHDAVQTSFFFALTEQQYNDLKKVCYEGKNKITKFKSDIKGELYSPQKIKIVQNLKHRAEYTFAVSSFKDSIMFRLPEEYHNLKFNKKLFQNSHFKCSLKEFEKLLQL